MAKREIIRIDEDKCNGCGLCIPNCPEGALQMIDGKARLVSDLFCDGLGACIGHCPQDAIHIEERQAQPYDEKRVMENIVKQGEKVIKAHLEHLRDHGQEELFREAAEFLKEKDMEIPVEERPEGSPSRRGGGPGSIGTKGSGAEDPGTGREDTDKDTGGGKDTAKPSSVSGVSSQLRQWPIQMHLISPTAPYYQGSDVLLTADCVAYSLGAFHRDYLKGKAVAIACPKLDRDRDVYVEKIRSWIEDARINTLTVLTMQVPCCRGLVELAKRALEGADRKVPIKSVVVSIKGEILNEEWLSV